jgi:hypothetical protein
VISDSIGRAAVRLGASYLRRRYRREIRIGLAAGAAAIAIAAIAYLARREVPEG